MPVANLLQQAVDLHRMGRTEEAVRIYKKVLRKDGRASGALNLLGLAEFQLGHLPEAADALSRAARLNPELPNVDYHLAQVFQAQGRHQEALPHFHKAIGRAPNDAQALNDLGKSLMRLGQHHEAITNFQRATSINPQLLNAWLGLGDALRTTYRFEESLDAYGKARALQPNSPALMVSIAYVLCRLDRARQAIEYGKSAVAADPSVAAHQLSAAAAFDDDGQDDEALKFYQRALELEPESADAQMQKGLFLLSRGHFAEGWALYAQRWRMIEAHEQRWHIRDAKLKQRSYTAPRWDGEHVAGTLLVWAEQGLGDQILYASMVSDLRARADRVVLEVDPRLVPLLARSFPDVTVIAQTETLFTGPIVSQTPLGDIGRYLRPDTASFSSSGGAYLAVDLNRATALRARLRNDRRRVIGISWGSTNPDRGRSKSARLAELLPVLQLPDCRFVDLQYGDTRADREQAEAATGVRIEHLDDIDNTNDIDGLAALIAACDAVVTVSNTTAHLAAAQGKATFVLLSSAGLFWYWMKRGDTTPLYPSATLFRKTNKASWTDVAATLAPSLGRYLGNLPGSDETTK